MKALVTGGAGFIGSHLVDTLLQEGWAVDVVDNFDPFYSPEDKRCNIAGHLTHPSYTLFELDIRDLEGMRKALPGGYNVIVHLAARAGVRASIEDPLGYLEVNVSGTQNMLELARMWGCKQFVFASSSSVYGVNPNVPWSEGDHVLLPISPYASTKLSGELLGHVYSHLHGIRFIGLRFFTVYGPRQRPDLAIHKFARNILDGQPISIYGDGRSRRDYTYIDDIVTGIRAAMDYSGSTYEIINLGNNHTVTLADMVSTLEQAFEADAILEYLPAQPGDVPQTWADTSRSERLLGFKPSTPFAEGVTRFARWAAESP